MTSRHATQRAFTIVELLVAAAITVVIVVLLGTMFGSLTSTASRANQRTDAFRDARAALQMMERDLSGLVRTLWQPDPFAIPTPATTQPLTRPAAYFALKNIYAESPASANQQLFALISTKNSDQGDVCAVGYYCRWNDQGYGYSLRRFFRPSGATFAALSSSPTYAADSALYLPDAVPAAGPLQDDLLAAHVWNLRITAYDSAGNVIRTDPTDPASPPKYPFVCDASGVDPTPPDPKFPAGRPPLPAAIEISFRAMNAEAARTIIAAKAGANVWMNDADPTYQRLIKPHAYEFKIRIKL